MKALEQDEQDDQDDQDAPIKSTSLSTHAKVCVFALGTLFLPTTESSSL